MKNDISQQAAKYLSIRRFRMRHHKIICVLAVIVAFCTTYALILPAITMERTTICGLEEHEHTEACYTEQQKLICSLEENSGHSHTEQCNESKSILVCELEEGDGYTHTHTEECYKGEVTVCELEEDEGYTHTHTEECYKEEVTLICGCEESDGHTHTEECYQTKDTLTCESVEHTHNEACYEKTKTDGELNTDVENKAELSEDSEEVILSVTTSDGITVILSGPSSSFPATSEELTFTVEELESSEDNLEEEASDIADENSAFEILDAALDEMGVSPVMKRLFDIKLWKNGEEVEPVGDVVLTFEGIITPTTASELQVYHIDEETARISDVVAEQNDQGDVVVSTDHFSVYGITYTNTALEATDSIAETVTTVDSKEKGITINLFDYQGTNLDTWANKVSSPVLNGINDPAVTGINPQQIQNGLLFLGSGAEATNMNPSNGINCYTGGNMALQGIVNNTLTDGYPTLTTDDDLDLSYLFDLNDIEDVKTVYKDVNYLFQIDSNGYYSYNSNKNYAYLNQDKNDEDYGNFTVYSNTYNNNEGAAIGFFPFNDYNSNYTEVKPDDNHYNHHFGMTIESKFQIPEYSKAGANDLVFDFSGDDDVWVFIDDVLVLDLGGIHGAVSGEINFTKGTVTVSDAKAASSAANTYITGESNTLKTIFEEAGKTYDGSPYSEHKISFFYLERGGCESDFYLRFNLPVYEEGTLEIGKEVEGGNSSVYKDQNFNFQLYLEDGTEPGKYEVYRGPAQYDDDTEVSFDDNGVFTLKPGQKVIIPQIYDTIKYYVKEISINDTQFDKVKANGEVCDPNYTESDSHVYSVSSSEDTVSNRHRIIFKNVMKETTTNLCVEKQWGDGNENHSQESITFQLYANNKLYTYNGNSSFTLNADNNWQMTFTNLPIQSAGDTYEYTVQENKVEGYTTSYKTTDDSDGTIKIQIVNEKEPKITVEKKWFNADGTPSTMNSQEITVKLLRRCQKTTSHTVRFYVPEVDTSTGTAVITPRQVGDEIKVAHGGSVTFAAAIWVGPSNVTSTGGTLEKTSQIYTFPNSLNVYIYKLSNIVQDEDITISFSVNEYGAIWDANFSEFKLEIIEHDKPGEVEQPSEDQWYVEEVGSINLNSDNNWRYEWTASDIDNVDSNGNQYYYYVEEVSLDDYDVTYENNGGITQGVITINNTAQFTIRLPDTGGPGVHWYAAGGILFMVSSVLIYIKKCTQVRNKI